MKKNISAFPILGNLYELLRGYKHQRQRKELRQNADVITKRLYEVFQNEKLEYFYIYGSLLGIVRENHFLLHDLDMDLGILDLPQNLIRPLWKKLRAHGFRVIRYCTLDNQITEFTCEYLSVPIDFFLFHKDGKKMISYEYYRRDDLTYPNDRETSVARLECCCTDGFIMKDLYCTCLRLPKNYEQILCDQYGPDWRVPNTSWKNEEAPNRYDCGEKRGYYINI